MPTKPRSRKRNTHYQNRSKYYANMFFDIESSINFLIEKSVMNKF